MNGTVNIIFQALSHASRWCYGSSRCERLCAWENSCECVGDLNALGVFGSGCCLILVSRDGATRGEEGPEVAGHTNAIFLGRGCTSACMKVWKEKNEFGVTRTGRFMI